MHSTAPEKRPMSFGAFLLRMILETKTFSMSVKMGTREQ